MEPARPSADPGPSGSAAGPAPGPTAGAIRAVISAIRRIRWWARAALVGGRVSLILAALLAAAVAGGFFDYILRTPAPIRFAVWLLAMGLVARAAWAWVLPAARFAPSETEVALRLERRLGRGLAAGVDLASGRADPDGQHPTLHRAAMALAARGRPPRVREAIQPGPTLRALGALAAVAGVCLGLAAARPTLFGIAMTRTLTPWREAAWPKRTMIVDVTSLSAHPIGAAIPIRGALVRTNRPQGRTDVWAVYRVIEGDRPGPWTRSLLTGQSRRVPVLSMRGEDPEQPWDGELYERLVQPATPSRGDGALTLEYRLETGDDATPETRIALVEPPRIAEASATIEPPEYARAAPGKFIAGPVALGAGLGDERGPVSPVLAGSKITLTLALNKPVAGTPEMIAGLPEGAESSLAGEAWTIAWIAGGTARLAVALVDEFGIPGDEDRSFAFDVLPDAPPSVAVVEPTHDEGVLPSARIPAMGEARDDLGSAWVDLRGRTLRGKPDSPGAPPEPEGEPVVLARAEPGVTEGADDARRVSARSVVVPGDLGLKPGDELHLTAVAIDRATDGRAPVVSAPRKLRIISPAELIEQALAELTAVRQAADRIDDDQARLMSEPEASAAGDSARRSQEAITSRAGPLREALERTLDRLERNALGDAALEGLVRDAAAVAQAARDRSGEAQATQERAAAEQATGEDVRAAQERVREELDRLRALLERGRDGYAARQSVERLLREQRDLQRRTDAQARSTAGRSADQLSPEQQREAAALADAQRDLARRTDETLSELAQRAERLEDTDRAQAQSIREAANRGRQEQVARRQEQASEDLAQNRAGRASEAQQQAAESLERMIEDIDRAERRRDQALRRMLADITAQIEALRDAQTGALAALGGARATGDLAALAEPMIALNRDTTGVAQRVRSGEREMRPLGEPLLAAARAQGVAIAALRAAPGDGLKADEHERLSLAKLNEALELAKKLAEQAEERETDRQREELREAYRQALEQQRVIREQTQELVGRELSRRDRQTLAELGDRQAALGEQIAALRSSSSEIADAGVFDYAHQRLDALTRAASAALRERKADAGVVRDQTSAERVLRSLVEALGDPKRQQDQPFRDMEGGGGGAGGGGSGQGGENRVVTPLAELRLLRLMQEDVAERTRSAADAPAVEEAGRLQRELHDRGRELLERVEREAQEQGAEGMEPEEGGEPAEGAS